MKKLLSTILAVAMLASMSTFAFADTITSDSKTSSKDVLAKIDDTSTQDTVYSVDVTWGDMEFTYEKSGSMEWNETTHQYNDTVTEGWTASGNNVTVTNHSNAAISASLSFTKNTNISDSITGYFDKSVIALPTAEGKTTTDPALTGTASLTLSGTPSTIGEDFQEVGTVTIQLMVKQ